MPYADNLPPSSPGARGGILCGNDAVAPETNCHPPFLTQHMSFFYAKAINYRMQLQIFFKFGKE